MQAYIRIDNDGDELTLVDNGQVALTCKRDWDNNAYLVERCSSIAAHKEPFDWFLERVCGFSLRQWGDWETRVERFRVDDIEDWCDAVLNPKAEEHASTKITGKYEVDDNFITVYTEDALYTISRKTGNWGRLKVDEQAACGGKLTAEHLAELRSKCTEEGTFELKWW